MNISNNPIENALSLQELYNYLQKQGHDIHPHKEYVKDAKADLVTWLTFGFTAWAAIYPMLKDLNDWSRPKKYTLSLEKDNVIATVNDLTEEEFLYLTEKLDPNNTKLKVNKS